MNIITRAGVISSHPPLFKFKYARESFRYLIQTFKIERIYLPYYLCDVMRHSAVEAGAKPIFYHIDDNFMPAENFPENEFILYPNYFGVCDKNIEKLVNIYPKLIVDNAHSFYSKPSGFACFNSERKFHPERINSYLWIKKEGAGIDFENPYKLPQIRQRKNIFIMWHKRLMNKNCLNLDLKKSVSPFCYPYLAADEIEADNLAAKLEQEGKTIYRYWNNLPKSFNEYKFYRCLVPIPLTP